MQKILLTIIISVFFIQSKNIETFKPVVVLELYTSQGCSSCPPADELLAKVKKEHSDNEVIALSYHVDYWNYIGWKDPFSKSEFSDKQRLYSRKFNSNSIYTPQIVVNGKEHFVGSDKSIMTSKLKSYLKKSAFNNVLLKNVKREADKIHFDYNIDGAVDKKTLRIALVINERRTSVKRGENKNRSLKNANIVVEEIYLNLNSATGNTSMSIPEIVTPSDNLSLVALVESENLDIHGGFQINL